VAETGHSSLTKSKKKHVFHADYGLGIPKVVFCTELRACNIVYCDVDFTIKLQISMYFEGE
jgi:hypothetical protein